MKRFMVCLALLGANLARGGDIGITIYNDRFACVKESRELELREGDNAVRLTDMPGQLDADSVVLRETGEEPFGVEVLEQRYVNEPLTEEILLREMEGREVRFREKGRNGGSREERGKVVRGGRSGWNRSLEPIVGTPGGVRFSLPGQPVFDGLDAAAYLKPSLEWVLRSDRAGRCPVEVSYLTGGLSWEATYNLVAEKEDSDEFSFSGWVSIRNDSGKDYPAAAIKLLAGDVHKVQRLPLGFTWEPMDFCAEAAEVELPEERRFDEFHLYTMPRRSTLKNGELKQIEFLRAEGVRGEREYVYEPLRGWSPSGYQDERRREAGLSGERKVAVFIDIANRADNGLGVPLPKGKMRLYRRDPADGRAELTDECRIGHTPKDESFRLDCGHAFDVVAERTQTDFEVRFIAGRAAERFEIKVRNHKATAVKVRLVEHLWRWANWEINEESAPHEKTASDRAEWVLDVPANGEAVLTYCVLYGWL